jgi:hypothetical protein
MEHIFIKSNDVVVIKSSEIQYVLSVMSQES